MSRAWRWVRWWLHWGARETPLMEGPAQLRLLHRLFRPWIYTPPFEPPSIDDMIRVRDYYNKDLVIELPALDIREPCASCGQVFHLAPCFSRYP